MQVLPSPALPEIGKKLLLIQVLLLYLRVLKLGLVSYTRPLQVQDEPVLWALDLSHHHLLS